MSEKIPRRAVPRRHPNLFKCLVGMPDTTSTAGSLGGDPVVNSYKARAIVQVRKPGLLNNFPGDALGRQVRTSANS
jgi:hypothetical protein